MNIFSSLFPVESTLKSGPVQGCWPRCSKLSCACRLLVQIKERFGDLGAELGLVGAMVGGEVGNRVCLTGTQSDGSLGVPAEQVLFLGRNDGAVGGVAGQVGQI